MSYEFDLGNNANNASRGLFVPTKMLEDNLLSDTTEAWECFTKQQFSGNLQAFLVNYVITISSNYSVYA